MSSQQAYNYQPQIGAPYGQQQIELSNPKTAAPAPGAPAQNINDVRLQAHQNLMGGNNPAAKSTEPRTNTPLDWFKIFWVMCATYAYTIALYAILMYIQLAIGQQIYMNICAGVFFCFYLFYLPTWWRFSSKGEAMSKALVEEKLRELEAEEQWRKWVVSGGAEAI